MSDAHEIREEHAEGATRYVLHVNGEPRVMLTARGGRVTMHFQVYGSLQYQEARALVAGLLDLTLIADKLSGNKK